MSAPQLNGAIQEPSDPRQLYLLPETFYVPRTASLQKEDQSVVEKVTKPSIFSRLFNLGHWKRVIDILRSPSELHECIRRFAGRLSGPYMWRTVQKELASNQPATEKLFPDAYRVEYGFEDQRNVPRWRIKWTVDLFRVDEGEDGRLHSPFPTQDDILKLENMQWIWENRQLPNGYTIVPPTGPVRVNQPRW